MISSCRTFLIYPYGSSGDDGAAFFQPVERKRLKPIKYSSSGGNIWVKVEAMSTYGMATIWDADTEKNAGDPTGISLTLSNWVYDGIIKQGGMLVIHPDYFRLTSGLERCLYRIARKHAGMQAHGWTCAAMSLYDKTGSDSP